MKTSRNFNRMVMLIVMTATLGGMVACKNTPSATGNTAIKMDKPSMDIFAASFMGDIKAISAHISIGTDLNQKDQFGSTPLIIATTFNKVEVAKALINAGADLSVKSADGSTALHTAAFFCRGEIVESLLNHGADKSLTNNYGSTPLESVSGDFEDVKGIYEQINKDLGPLGLRLDLNYLEENRPKMADLLK
nr:ankyrin repeat domain-containing protein [uncultured Carboxylicivirga sp.]